MPTIRELLCKIAQDQGQTLTPRQALDLEKQVAGQHIDGLLNTGDPLTGELSQSVDSLEAANNEDPMLNEGVEPRRKFKKVEKPKPGEDLT